MKYLPKDAHKLPDKELVKYLFPEKALKKTLEEINQKPKRKLRAKKS
jgi:hypothetical protein